MFLTVTKTTTTTQYKHTKYILTRSVYLLQTVYQYNLMTTDCHSQSSCSQKVNNCGVEFCSITDKTLTVASQEFGYITVKIFTIAWQVIFEEEISHRCCKNNFEEFNL